MWKLKVVHGNFNYYLTGARWRIDNKDYIVDKSYFLFNKFLVIVRFKRIK